MNEIEDGKEATRLLNNELLQRVLQNIVLDLETDWLRTKPEEKDKRELLYMEAKGVERFGYKLKAIEGNGLLMQKRG